MRGAVDAVHAAVFSPAAVVSNMLCVCPPRDREGTFPSPIFIFMCLVFEPPPVPAPLYGLSASLASLPNVWRKARSNLTTVGELFESDEPPRITLPRGRWSFVGGGGSTYVGNTTRGLCRGSRVSSVLPVADLCTGPQGCWATRSVFCLVHVVPALVLQ